MEFFLIKRAILLFKNIEFASKKILANTGKEK